MKLLSLVRFFAVVLRSHVTLTVTTALLVGMAVWMARNDAQDIEQVFTLALFVQMFAAASGFREPARKGHFDPVLATGTPRVAAAAAHWTTSTAPGLLAWAALSMVVLWVRPNQVPVGFTVGGLITIVYVSTASWAVALPFTRYVSGVIWMLALVVLSGMNLVSGLRDAFLANPADVESLLRQVGAALVCPVFLVASGQTVGASALSLIVLATVVLMGIGGLFIVTLDAPLEDPS